MAQKSHWIREPRQLRCLASAVRQEIVDTVHSLGSCSIAEIARLLGRPADGLYYHVKQLVDCGLLIEQGTEKNNRREEVIYAVPHAAQRMQIDYQPDDPVNRRHVTRIVDSLLNTARQDFNRGLESADCVVRGDHRNLWAARSKGWLKPDELVEVNELLNRLSDLLNQKKSPERRELYVLSWVMAPVEVQPVRRD
jgi:hypothetical protein